MKKYINIIICILTIPLLWSSCRDDIVMPSSTGQSEVSVYIRMQTPAVGQFPTRAVNETQISSINVLVFEDTGTGYRFSYLVSGYSLTSTGASTYDFYARISTSDNPVKLYFLANVPTATNTLAVGNTEEEVKEALIGTFGPDGFDGSLPMFGELEYSTGISEDIETTVDMVRSVARVDVINTADNFVLTSIQVYRASNQYQIIPDILVDSIVTSPSIPAGTIQSVNTIQLSTGDTISAQQVYLPESPIITNPADRRLGATVVVIGGLFGTDTDTTYYRMDFVPDSVPEAFGQILRNHRYQFNVRTVLAPGWPDPGEASENEPSQIEAEIVVWNETTVDMVFDEVHYFGVSSRVARLSSQAGSADTIIVQTNLDTYQLYWSDGNNTIDDSVAPITLGETFSDPDSLFTVSISDDGSRIYVVADSTNRTESEVTRYLLASANRLRSQITIVQDRVRLLNRALKVYGPDGEIGSLGNQVLPNAPDNIGTSAQGLRAFLTNSANFGPSGIIPIEGVVIGGLVSYQISTATAELFDVLYFPYPATPDATSIGVITSWLNANDRRVLIVHYDNPSTNRALLEALGLPANSVTEAPQQPGFTLSPDAPSVITNGVFGTVPADLAYRSFDNTHGRISLTTAETAGITPILLASNGEMVFGIDFNRRIVYSGDVDLYNSRSNERPGSYMSTTGVVGDNPANILIGNIWAWIANIVLTE